MSKVNLSIDPEKLKCATCKRYLYNPPVFVQDTGDTICEKCHNASNKKSAVRNRLYEDMMKCALFPCQYAFYGCTALLGFNNTSSQSHESVCQFKVIKCPIDECEWYGKVELIFKHFLKGVHGDAVLIGKQISFQANGEVFKLLREKDRSYVVWINAANQKIRIEVINLCKGSSVEYDLTLYNPDGVDDVDVRKSGYTRLLCGTKQAVEFDKKLITEMLGKFDRLECFVTFLKEYDSGCSSDHYI